VDAFEYRDDSLYVEDVPADDLAEAYGTPIYVYSRGTLLSHMQRVADAFQELAPLICFSVKSLSNIHLLREMAAAGAGVDVVSGGELHRALVAGVPPERIVFAGVGKSGAELRMAARHKVRSVNVESEGEFEALGVVASECRERVGVAVRVNPDVAPATGTPDKTTTGRRGGKFGVDLSRVVALYQHIVEHEWMRPEGLHFHLGSPIYDVTSHAVALDKILDLRQRLAAGGAPVPTINIGGGFPADYEGLGVPAWSDYAATIVPRLRSFVAAGGRVVLEPGRSITANAGVLLTRVLYVKRAGSRRVVVADTGMSHFLRTSFYETHQFVWPTRPRHRRLPVARTAEQKAPGLHTYDIVGPLCESSDYLARARPLPRVTPGDLLAIFTAGAYGMTMASQYNGIPRPPEVLVSGTQVQLIRRRETYHDLVAAELDLPPPTGHRADPAGGTGPARGPGEDHR
jgi:diaminopimelate decarboxylase